MAQKKKYQFAGKEVMGEEIDFETDKESWSIYILHDGTKIKIKPVAMSFVRLEEYNPAGEPIYLINAQNLVSADVPDVLKKA